MSLMINSALVLHANNKLEQNEQTEKKEKIYRFDIFMMKCGTNTSVILWNNNNRKLIEDEDDVQNTTNSFTFCHLQ